MASDRPRTVGLAVLTVAAALLAPGARACTAIGVGRRASADGSVMVAHSDDSGGMGDPRLIHVPARDWPANASRPVYLSVADFPRLVAPERAPEYAPRNGAEAALPWTTPLGSVDQPAHTYAYWDADYGVGNEHQLVMAETTCAARLKAVPLGFPNGTALFGLEELTRVALERCRTARCAVRTMGTLAETHGYYGGNAHLGKSDPWPGTVAGEEGEALVIGDAVGELWVFHILPGPEGRGAVWAAQRMPDDSVVVVANMFVIREMNLADPDWFLASADVEGVARRLGFWDPAGDGPFDFTRAFSGNVLATDPRKRLVNQFYSGRRIWRVFDLVAPSLRLDGDLGCLQDEATYPVAVRPDKPVTLEAMFDIYRDHYQGTPYDLSAGLAAGPYGTPNRWSAATGEDEAPGGWERAISMFRTLYSFVAQARPEVPAPLGGLVWWGTDSPHATCYFPFYLSQGGLPTAYMSGTQAEFSLESAWWVFNTVKRFMDLNFAAMREDVAVAQRSCEEGGRKVQAEAEARAMRLLRPPPRAMPTRKALLAVRANASDMALDDAATSSDARGADSGDSAAEAELGKAAVAEAIVQAAAVLENATSTHAAEVMRSWASLWGSLMAKYKNGYSNEPVAPGITREHAVGYPAWWLQRVGYTEWPEWVAARSAKAFQRRHAAEDARPDAARGSDTGTNMTANGSLGGDNGAPQAAAAVGETSDTGGSTSGVAHAAADARADGAAHGAGMAQAGLVHLLGTPARVTIAGCFVAVIFFAFGIAVGRGMGLASCRGAGAEWPTAAEASLLSERDREQELHNTRDR